MPKLEHHLVALTGVDADDTQIISVELFAGADGRIPTERELFAAGQTDTSKGKFLFDEIAGRSVMSSFAEHGNELPFDYDHKMLDTYGPPENGKAAGWFQLELRNGALWATNIRWTPAAADMIRNREFRYISPAFLADRETGRVMRVINVAITNIPATKRMRPLVTRADVPAAITASETAPKTKGTGMDLLKILAALLACEATEEAVVTACKARFEEGASALADVAKARDLIGLTAADPIAPKLIELVAASARVPQLEASLVEAKTQTAQLQADKDAETAKVAAALLADAEREVDWIIQHAARYDLGTFKNAEGAKRMLLAARAADRETFAFTYKAALDGLAAGDTDDTFRAVSGSPIEDKVSPVTAVDATAQLLADAEARALKDRIPLTQALRIVHAEALAKVR